MIFSAFSSLDIFPNRVQLNIKSSDKFRTSTGVILTIVVLGITLIEAITTLISIFDYHSPQITNQRGYVQNPPDLGLNSSNFVFAIRVNDPNYNLSQSYISFHLQYFEIVRNSEGVPAFNIVPIPLKKCDLDYMKGFESDYFWYEMDAALCPTVDAYPLIGTYLTSNFSFFGFAVSPCANDSSVPDVICQPIEAVEYHMTQQLQIQMLFSNTIIDPSNHSNPVTRFIDEYYWDTTPNFTSMEGDLFINQQDIVSDDFLWFSGFNVKTQTSYQIDYAEARTLTSFLQRIGPDPDDYVIIDINIKRSNYVYTTTRSYSTVYSGLSSIGGIFSLIFAVFGLTVAAYTRRAYLLSVANEMYEFELPDYLDKNKHSKSRCCRRRKKQSEPAISSIRIDPNSKDGNFSEKLQEFAKHYFLKSRKEKRKLDYGFFDFILSIFCCGRREKDKFVKRAIETVTGDTDVLYLIKITHENERLKNVLLSKEQQDLLCYSSHPVIITKDLWKKTKSEEKNSVAETMKEETKDESTKNKKMRLFAKKNKGSTIQNPQKETEYDKFMTLCSSYKKVFGDCDQPVNHKILELLDPNIHEALYEVSQQLKEEPETFQRSDSRSSNKSVVFVRNTSINKKLSAAVTIAKNLKSKFKERRTNSLFSKESRFSKDMDNNSREEESKVVDTPNHIDIEMGSPINQSKSIEFLQIDDVGLDETVGQNIPYKMKDRVESPLNKSLNKRTLKRHITTASP